MISRRPPPQQRRGLARVGGEARGDGWQHGLRHRDRQDPGAEHEVERRRVVGDGGERQERADEEAIGVDEGLRHDARRAHPTAHAHQRQRRGEARRPPEQARQQRPRQPSIGERVGEPAGDEGQHHRGEAVPDEQNQHRAEIVEDAHRDRDEVRLAEAPVGGQHAPERGVHHHQGRGRGQHAQPADRLLLQRGRHQQHALHQRRNAPPQSQRGDGAGAEQQRERRPDQLRALRGRAAGADPLGEGAGEGLSHPEVEHAEHAHHGEREGEQAPPLRAELADQYGGEHQREQQRQAAAGRVPSHPRDHGAAGAAGFGFAHNGFS